MRGRRSLAVTPSKIRSAIANGSRVLDGIDARSAPARRYRDITQAIAADLGGIEHLTEAQIQLVRSAAGLVVLRERLDALALNGEEIDVAAYTRIANTLRRVLTTIGLKREPRDVTPDLDTYLRTRGSKVIDHDETEDDEAA